MVKLKRFEVLSICKDGIKDDDLKFIASLPNIKLLELNADTGCEGSPICTDRCAGYLSRAKTLRTVIIYDRKLTDKFVDKLTHDLPSLEMLAIGSPAFHERVAPVDLRMLQKTGTA